MGYFKKKTKHHPKSVGIQDTKPLPYDLEGAQSSAPQVVRSQIDHPNRCLQVPISDLEGSRVPSE